MRLTNVEPQSRSVMRLLGADAAWFREPHPSDPRGHDVPHGDYVQTSPDTAVTVNGRCQARSGRGPDDPASRRWSAFRTHTSEEGPMSSLRDILQSYVSDGSVPGAVGLVARGDRVEVMITAGPSRPRPFARQPIERVNAVIM